jgi:hypothetical protein
LSVSRKVSCAASELDHGSDRTQLRARREFTRDRRAQGLAKKCQRPPGRWTHRHQVERRYISRSDYHGTNPSDLLFPIRRTEQHALEAAVLGTARRTLRRQPGSQHPSRSALPHLFSSVVFSCSKLRATGKFAQAPAGQLAASRRGHGR